MRSIGRLVMVLCVFGAFFAADAAAFNVNVSTTPTTTQAGGHPNFKLQLTRTGSDSEDLKDLQIDLPPGLIGNPEAASAKCTKAQFQADSCPQGSTVGTVEAGGERPGPHPAARAGHDLRARTRPRRRGHARHRAAPASPGGDRQDVLGRTHQDVQDGRTATSGCATSS